MKWRRWIGGGLLVVVGLILVCAAGLYASAWYHRWRAEQLFAAVRDLKPGVTTEAEYMEAIAPQVRYAVQAETGDPPVSVAGYLAVGNQPLMVWNMFNHLPNRVTGFLSNWSALQWALFDVDGTFRGGKLATLHIGEMQGSGHPYGGFVTIHAGRLEHFPPRYPEVFTGYFASRMGGNGTVIYTHVDMDDRVTDEQRRRALDFKFDCFTAFHRCTDGRRMLDPTVTDGN